MKCLIVIFLMLPLGCASLEQVEREQAVQHVVLCWLKEPGNPSHRARIMEVSRTFRSIPGVLEVRVGEAIASDRKIVDGSFDVAILVVVPDGRRLQEYLDHPIHDQAKQDVLLPLVDRVVVYDFQK